MNNDVKRVVEACEVCRKYEKQAKVQHPVRAIKTSYIHCMFGMNLVLGFPESEEGYIGLFVITEYLTKYPYVKPIKSKTAKEIALLLWEYITLFGPPKIILSDNGTEFVNTNYTPFKLMFGRRMFAFEDYSNTEINQERIVDAVYDRSLEIWSKLLRKKRLRRFQRDTSKNTK